MNRKAKFNDLINTIKNIGLKNSKNLEKAIFKKLPNTIICYDYQACWITGNGLHVYCVSDLGYLDTTNLKEKDYPKKVSKHILKQAKKNKFDNIIYIKDNGFLQAHTISLIKI